MKNPRVTLKVLFLLLIATPAYGATLTVTKTADTNDGICNADCSLREAIGAAASQDTIVFSSLFGSAQSIVLTQGRILIDKSLTINAPGANLLSISGNDANRVFSFFDSNPNDSNIVTISLSGVAIIGGFVSPTTPNGTDGGGLLNDGATVTLTDVVVRNNRSTNSGGGIHNRNRGRLTVTNSTIDNNLAGFDAGIFSDFDCVLLIANSTISRNTATSSGAGGIESNGQTTITNSTISGNRITGDSFNDGGGGVLAKSGSLSLVNSTIAFNSSSSDAAGLGRYGGTATVRNSIIANNTASNGSDVTGTFTSQGHNLIGRSGGTAGFVNGVNGDIVGGLNPGIDPLLGSLQNNGGPTETHLIAAGSPALNAGNNCVVAPATSGGCLAVPLMTDQRGPGFGRRQGAAVDLGATELASAPADPFTVVQFGAGEDIPLPGDFDGDGRPDISVFRPSNGTWYRLNSSNGLFVARQFGQLGDRPLIGDFDGDRKADYAVFRPSNGIWYYIRSRDDSFYGEQWGASGDNPLPADYDGDGKADLAVFRPSAGAWYIRRTQ